MVKNSRQEFFNRLSGWRSILSGIVIITGFGLIGITSAHAGDKPVTLESLLNEMIDRDGLARWPNPAYTSKEFTSYDRRSISPDQPGWFANTDYSNFLRVENHAGRTEYVMMDTDGPGAIVCMFKATTDPAATVRIYLDDSPTPVIEENFRYFLGGAFETDQEKHFPEKRVPPFPADQASFLGGFGTIKPPLAGVESLRVASIKKDTEGVNKKGWDWCGRVRDLFTNARRAR